MDVPNPSRLSRRRLIAGGLALGTVPMLPRFLGSAAAAPSAFGFPEPDLTSVIVRSIEFPVEGTVSWTDTYGACRDNCTRLHEGEDLIGSKLQKLLACVDGTVVGFKYDTTGNYLYLRDADGWHYGYLHINNDDPGTDDGLNPRAWAFAPGIGLGSAVRRGQFIAYMGDSGNAEYTVPHLHYEIRKPATAWYNAQAINPKYSLDNATHLGDTSATFSPFSTASAFVNQQYVDFLNRRPSSSELSNWTTQLNSGAKSPADMIEWIIQQPGSDDTIAPLIRLYWGCFNRLPDSSGLMYWIGRLRAGTSLDAIADKFSVSAEFLRRFGGLSNGQYVDSLYLYILGRAPDSSGRQYWINKLAAGMSRGRMMRYFVESDHYRYLMYFRVRISLVYAGMLRRAPDSSGFAYWLDRMTNHGTQLQSLISAIQKSASYRSRFSTTTQSTATASPQTSASPDDGLTVDPRTEQSTTIMSESAPTTTTKPTTTAAPITTAAATTTTAPITTTTAGPKVTSAPTSTTGP